MPQLSSKFEKPAREVGRVAEEDGPLAVDPIVPVDLALGGHGREVRHDVAQAQHL